jgi:hypothetical protein
LCCTGGEGCKSAQEEVKTGEGNKVHCKLAEILIELSRETERASDSRHDCRNEMVQVSISGSGQLEGTEANVVQCLVINAESFIRVLNELMDRQSAVVGLNHSV